MARSSLSGILSRTRGRVGEDVLILTRSGLVVRPRPRYRQFPHPEAAGARARLLAARDAWLALTPAEVAAWRGYARGVRRVNPVDGTHYSPIAYNAFTALATRYLQGTPGGQIPRMPPTSDFPGDSPTLTVAPIPGGVRFAASGPNSAGASTELMVQRLENARRAPRKFYKSGAFHAFAPGTLTFDLDLDLGAYALAYRFLRLATGQDTEALLLGVVEVTG